MKKSIKTLFRASTLSFFLLLLLLNKIGLSQTKTTDKDYILILNTYTSSAPWSSQLVNEIQTFLQDNDTLECHTEHMNMLWIDTEDLLSEFREKLFRKYSAHTPRMIVMLGDSPLLLRDEIREQWGDMPVILCAEKDYYGPREAYLRKLPVPYESQLPIKQLSNPYNLVFLYSNLFVSHNVTLMHYLLPNMQKLIFVGDNTYVNVQNDREIRELLKASKSPLSYQFLSAKNTTVDQLLDTLNHIDQQTTGVLFSTWFDKEFIGGNLSVMVQLHKIIGTVKPPLFVLRTLGIEEEGGIIGGYVYKSDDYNKALMRTITQVLEGEQPRNLPTYYPMNAFPLFNYESLLEKGLSPGLCPPGTQFYKTTPSFWEQYKYTFFGTCLGLLIISLIFQYKRIQTLRKLKDAKQKEIEMMTEYRNLVDSMPILYMQEKVITNPNGEIIDTEYCNVNTYFEKNFFPRSEIIGKKGSEIFPESMPEFLHFIHIALSENRSISFPYYFRKIDTFFNVMLKGSHHPGVVDIFCIDNTELHQAQQKLSSTNHKLSMALEVANIVPWKWDLRKQTILCDVNKPIELSSYEKSINEEQLAVPDIQYFAKIYKPDRERVQQAYQDLINGKVNKVREEYRIINTHHKIDWVEAQAAVETRDEQGRPLTLVGSSLVITNRKHMEEELTSAKDRAEESNRLKSAFLANMSHEIRTPLNAIVGFSGILASTEEEHEKKEYINIIENNNALLLQLISDILDLSKIEAGTLDFHYSDIELNEMIRELESTLHVKMKSDQVKLESYVAQDLCPVHIEKNRVSQVIINLVTNAIKFTEKGYIHFGYKIHGKELYFYVTDTGCGIPADKQQSVFGRFVKLNSFQQGTGLGLSICQTLIEHMGGQIGLESEEGKGSTFWFTLPYEPITITAKHEEAPHPIVVTKDKLTILIAEDNESNYKLFESILKHDYHLVHAWDGREAVELYQEYDPQIILMDINMPIMDGYEAAHEIRKHSAKVPIIAVTAFAYASDEQKAIDSGFDGYMPKPINARALKEQIISIMQKRIVFL